MSDEYVRPSQELIDALGKKAFMAGWKYVATFKDADSVGEKAKTMLKAAKAISAAISIDTTVKDARHHLSLLDILASTVVCEMLDVDPDACHYSNRPSAALLAFAKVAIALDAVWSLEIDDEEIMVPWQAPMIVLQQNEEQP